MYIFLIVFLCLLLIYLIAIAPRLINRKDLTRWKGEFFAHRGFHSSKANIPENSLLAFKKAVEHGYGIELDIRLTKDRIPVVFHDADLSRMCQVDKQINELTLAELDHYPLDQMSEKIPTLESVLSMVDGKVPLIVEFKADDRDLSVCQSSQPLLDAYKGDYCIESFNPLVLLWFKKNHPDVIRGQLSSKMITENKDGDKRLNFMLQHMLFNFITKPDFIAFNHKYTRLLSFQICRKLFRAPSFAWTIETLDELEKSKKKFDSFIFEKFLPHDMIYKKQKE